MTTGKTKYLAVAMFIGAFSLAMLSGCQEAGWLGYVFASETKNKCKAEFPDMEGKKIAIFLIADREVLVNYPQVPDKITEKICFQIKANSESKAKGLNKTTVLNPDVVTKFKDENPDWAAMERNDIVKKLGVDYVVFVSLIEFKATSKMQFDTRGGSVHSEIKVYARTSPKPQWEKDDFSITYPEEGQRLPSKKNNDERFVMEETASIYADRLVKKFCDYKE